MSRFYSLTSCFSTTAFQVHCADTDLKEIKNLERKEKRTKEDEEMLSLLKNGGVIRDQEKLNEIMSALDEMDKRQ